MKVFAENARIVDTAAITVPTTSAPKIHQNAFLLNPEWSHPMMKTTAAALTSATTWEEWICDSFGLTGTTGLHQSRRLSTIKEGRDEENETDASARRIAANGAFVHSSSSLLELDDDSHEDDEEGEDDMQDERKIQETPTPAHSRNSSFVDNELIIVEKREKSFSAMFTPSSFQTPNQISHTKQMRVPRVSQTRRIDDSLCRDEPQPPQSSPRGVSCLDTKSALQDLDEMFNEAATAAIAAVAMDGLCSTNPTNVPTKGNSAALELPSSPSSTSQPLSEPFGAPKSPTSSTTATVITTSPRRREHKHRRSYGQLPDWTGQLSDPLLFGNDAGENLAVPGIQTTQSLPLSFEDDQGAVTQMLPKEQKE